MNEKCVCRVVSVRPGGRGYLWERPILEVRKQSEEGRAGLGQARVGSNRAGEGVGEEQASGAWPWERSLQRLKILCKKAADPSFVESVLGDEMVLRTSLRIKRA